MNNNASSRAVQWLPHYEPHQVQEITPCFNAISMTSPSGSSLGDGGVAAAHETAGRRSRAPKRAIPTTLLNANPSNFRTLVQKFTGRSAVGESIRRKGPVTLDFRSPTTISKEAIFPVSGDRNNYDKIHDHALTRHVSSEQRHPTWSGEEVMTLYQSGEKSNSEFNQDHDLLREYSGKNSYDESLDHKDYCYHDFYLETATLEEFMLRDLDL
ncbi:unnamed protein product [Eruca vesicaria subsp. sativa]|uniref:VQ domain-containing protein n=1 Tax=Eruca vesicaria subsp. sativa TaxID=29727 RepID=A0ABC8JY41_ERUVS|nr:unnamed protein product [Eruca vesicaria subsp. sativa]